MGGLLVLGYSLKTTHELSRIVLGSWSLATPFVLLSWRVVMRSILENARSKGYNTRSAVIFGTDSNAVALAKNILSRPWMGLAFKGFLSEDEPGTVCNIGGKDWGIIGDSQDLINMARANEIDIVYIAIPMNETATRDMIISKLGDTTVSIFIVPDMYTVEMMQGTWISVGDIATVSVIDGLFHGDESWIKRLEDIVLATLAIVVFAIPMAVIALAVKLTSKGPVLFKQLRYGLNGDPISVWKFRSMTVTENGDEFVQVKLNDPRITTTGRFLRRSSFDELPQLFNVLTGNMSIVGPRPHATAHNEEFRGKIKGYMLRHKVKPGITGLAQVSGYRGETDTDEKMEQRIRHDVHYICNWSIWLDLAIILKTPLVVWKGRNGLLNQLNPA